jgi:hypothetical protein
VLGISIGVVVSGPSVVDPAGRRLLGVLLLVGGILAIAIGAYIASTPTDIYVDFAAAKAAADGQLDEAKGSLTRLFEASNLQADQGIGLYVVIGGGLLSAVGGLDALFGRRVQERS